MKKLMFTLFALLTLSATASAMSYEQARNEALFLTDKMAYELNLTDAQYEAAYEINLDYLMGVTSRYDVYGPYWERRNLDLSYILFSWQWDLFRAATYFYRPLYWDAGYWHFGVYARYPHRDYFYFGRPHFYASYRGGHSWRLNGGRSYYEGRRDFYRPSGHSRDNHFGMRNGWDRGDYRGGRVTGGSSTRHTQGGNNGGHFDGNDGRNNHNNGGFNSGNGGHHNNDHGNRTFNGQNGGGNNGNQGFGNHGGGNNSRGNQVGNETGGSTPRSTFGNTRSIENRPSSVGSMTRSTTTRTVEGSRGSAPVQRSTGSSSTFGGRSSSGSSSMGNRTSGGSFGNSRSGGSFSGGGGTRGGGHSAVGGGSRSGGSGHSGGGHGGSFGRTR